MNGTSDELLPEDLIRSPVRGTGSWTPARDGNGRGKRRILRILFSLLGLGTVGAFLYLLASPFANPDIHLVAVALGPGQVESIPTNVDIPAERTDYRFRDLDALQTLGERLHVYDDNHPATIFRGTRTSADVPALGKRLLETIQGRSNVLLVYLAAEGIADGQTARLRWWIPGNGAQPQQGTVQQFLEQIPRDSASVKLLILDIKASESEESGTTIADEFPRLLRLAVLATKDESLWVLTSHSTFEKSRADQHLRRGIFGFFVTRGLTGAADLNDDRVITLRELHAYVSSSVSAWVSQQSAFRASQTPQLIWGGGKKWPRTLPNLIPALTRREEFAAVVPESAEGDSDSNELSTKRLFPADVKVVGERSLAPLELFPRVPDFLNDAPPDDPSPKADKVAKTDSAAGAKTAKADPADPKAKPMDSAAADGGGKTEEESQTKAASIAEQIAATWKLRDELLDRRFRAVTPLDFAPHLWRDLEMRLIAYEASYRSLGPFPKPAAKEKGKEGAEKTVPQTQVETIARGLNELQRLMKILAEQNGTESPTAGRRELRFVRYVKQKRHIVTDPRSLGFAEWLDRRQDRKLTTDERRSMQKFDRLVSSGSHADFADTVGKLTSQELRWTEWQLAASFALRPRIDWPSVRTALAVRRYGEQVAASAMGRLAWVREIIETADSLRLSGERRLLDQIGADFASSARAQLKSSLQTYQRASDRIATIESLRNAAKRSLHRLRGDLEFWQSAAISPAEQHRAQERLAAVIRSLKQSAQVLDAPPKDNNSFETIRRLHRRLASLDDDIQRMTASLIRDESTTSTSNTVVASNDLEQRLNILATSRLAAEDRLNLLKGIPNAAYASARSIRLPQTILGPVEPRTTSPEDWQRAARWGALYVGLAELCAIDGSHPPGQKKPTNANSSIRRIGETFREFQTTAANLKTAPSAIDEGRVWEIHRQFAAELSQFFQSLSARIVSTSADADKRSATSPAARARLARAARALRIISARNVSVVGQHNLVEQLRRVDVYDLMSWLRKRAVSAERDADEADLAKLDATAASYREQIRLLTGQSNAAAVATRLRIDGPSIVDLTVNSFRDVEIQTVVNGTGATRAWNVLEYDPEIIEVELSAGESAFNMQALRQARNAGLYPYRPQLPARVVLKPGRKSSLRFRVKRLQPTLSEPTRLVVRTITDSEYRRKTIDVLLPSPEILVVEAAPVEATAGTVSQRGAGVVLHPFPNRETDFTLSLKNAGRIGRTVDVELFASPVRLATEFPSQELDALRTTNLLGQMRSFRLTGSQKKIEIPGGGKAVTLQLAPAPAAAGNAKSPDAADGIRLQHGFVLVIRDPNTKGAFFRRVAFAPQRPRRFLKPRLAYDRSRRIINVRITPYDKAALPTEPVKVTAELRPTGIATEPLLAEAEISRDNPQLNLSLPIPPRNDRIVEVRIHVDGFPRAFIYRVATDRSAVDLPEWIGRKRVTIVEPLTGLGVSAKTKSVKAVVQVDAPVGSFQDDADFAEFGIDINRDRRLTGDPTQRFQNDRQLDLRLKELADGVIKIGLKVADFQISLPAAPMNQRVNLIGRLVTDGKTAWSRPIELVFDAQPPQLFRMTNSVATVGKPFKVSLNVTDQGLSGVDKVEFLLDVARIGEFPADAAPIAGEPAALGNWTANIDPGKAPPGTYSLLVRATDRVGNVSKPIKARVRLLSEAESAVGDAGTANRVSGVVTFDKEPVAGATVSLGPKAAAPVAKQPQAAKTEKIKDVTTDEQGRFTFTKVPPGDYVLTVKKRAVANKNRKVQLPLKVDPKPAFIPLQRINLR